MPGKKAKCLFWVVRDKHKLERWISVLHGWQSMQRHDLSLAHSSKYPKREKKDLGWVSGNPLKILESQEADL